MSELAFNPWEVWEVEFPSNARPARQWLFLLNYAVLAPSNHNAQPWLFQVQDESVALYADRARALPVVDPDDRELIISCGAALFNLRTALRHFGYTGDLQTFPDATQPDLLARVRWGNRTTPTADEDKLFSAIRERRTNRQAFAGREVPASLLIMLQEEAHIENAWLAIIQGEDERNAVADLIARGDQIQWADKHFRRELAAWSCSNRSHRHDGIPGFSRGLGDIMSYAGPLIERTFDMGHGEAAKDRQLATGSPVLAVLGTDADTPQDWLAAGQALERVMLRARAEEVWTSFLNQPIEVTDLRMMLHNLIERRGFPQLLLRMGYGTPIESTPRRGVHEVLL